MSIQVKNEIRSKYPNFSIAWCTAHIESPLEVDTSQLIERSHEFCRTHKEAALSKANGMETLFRRLNPKSRYHISSLIKSAASGRKYRPKSYLVDLVYCVELEHTVLMGLHDCKTVDGPIVVSSGSANSIDHISGNTLDLPESDIVMAVGDRVIASVAGGPDDHTKVTADTREAIIMAYGTCDPPPDDLAGAFTDLIAKSQAICGDAVSFSTITSWPER